MTAAPPTRCQPEISDVRQILGAFYKTVDVMKSAYNSDAKLMGVWADDLKAVEDVMLFLEAIRDAPPPMISTLDDARGELLALADRLAAPRMNKTRHEERMLNGHERDLIVAALRAAPVPQCGALEDAIKPHLHVPDLETMGDCRVCGHPRKSPWHIAALSTLLSADRGAP